MPRTRDSHGRYKADHRTRNLALAAGTALVAGGAALIGIFARRREGLFAPANAEHGAPDLAGAAHPDGSGRAPNAFHPDPTAPVPPGERDGLRPATGPAPTMVG